MLLRICVCRLYLARSSEVRVQRSQNFGHEAVSLVVRKGVRLRWFGHVRCVDRTGWIKCCTTMESDRRDIQTQRDGIVLLKNMKSSGLPQTDAPV